MAVSVSCSSHQQTMGGGSVGEGSNPSLFLSLLDGVRRSSQIWRLVRASPYSNSSPPSLASNYKDEEEGSKEALPPPHHITWLHPWGAHSSQLQKSLFINSPKTGTRRQACPCPHQAPAQLESWGGGGYP